VRKATTFSDCHLTVFNLKAISRLLNFPIILTSLFVEAYSFVFLHRFTQCPNGSGSGTPHS